MASRMDRARRKSMSPEERYQRAVSARRKFRALVKLIIANLSWLQELEDEKLGDNVKKNIQVLTRKKGKKSLLTLKDKAVLNKPQELRTEAEKNHLRRIIGNLKCFRRYPPEVKSQLPGIMYFNYFGPNRIVVKQDYEALNLYVILTGEVVVSQTYYDKLLKENVTKDVLLMGPGNYFGEVGLLHNIARTATVTTTEATEFLYVKREDFDRVLKDTVASQWAEVQENMSWFTYFQNWSEVDIRESCILAKKKNFEPDQIVLSSTGGQLDCVYFITKGSCYLIEYMTIKTTWKKGLPHYTLVKEAADAEARPPAAVYKDIKKLHKKEESHMGLKSSLRPAISTSRPSLRPSYTQPNIQTHFIKVCTFNKLACFNVGESLKNRIIVSSDETECLLLPRYFLLDKSMITFKAIEQFLTRHIPSTEQIFKNFLEDHRWSYYKGQLVEQILADKAFTGNTVHNIPYTIRLAEDLGEI
ncbi:cyclic nucleotide-binding domain-containing protein 2-like [Tribolium madens]|uniref:cyclic nucleotide-binding domain-containing protein 2-like n=1 Tax=Tribolium madens TaxID=41895 RepID=UPI001CF7373F|nr:cyclic nucleotide-binding domain-containing protein 2-like [Tribolium madens]